MLPVNNSRLTTVSLDILATIVTVWICYRIPGQYFTGDNSWGVEPVNVSSTNQKMYKASELLYSHSPTVLAQDVALYNDYVKEIMIWYQL